jgi:hypothetical protein
MNLMLEGAEPFAAGHVKHQVFERELRAGQDLPLPDVADDGQKVRLASLLAMASTRFSRPKDRCSSSSLKGRGRGKGSSAGRPRRSS